MSGYRKKRNKDGDMTKECIISLKLQRKLFEDANVEQIIPKDFIMRFENRCNITPTFIFREVKPFKSGKEDM